MRVSFAADDIVFDSVVLDEHLRTLSALQADGAAAEGDPAMSRTASYGSSVVSASLLWAEVQLHLACFEVVCRRLNWYTRR